MTEVRQDLLELKEEEGKERWFLEWQELEEFVRGVKKESIEKEDDNKEEEMGTNIEPEKGEERRIEVEVIKEIGELRMDDLPKAPSTEELQKKKQKTATTKSIREQLKGEEERLRMIMEEEKIRKARIVKLRIEAELRPGEADLLKQVYAPRSVRQMEKFEGLKVEQWGDLNWEEQKRKIAECLKEEDGTNKKKNDINN